MLRGPDHTVDEAVAARMSKAKVGCSNNALQNAPLEPIEGHQKTEARALGKYCWGARLRLGHR